MLNRRHFLAASAGAAALGYARPSLAAVGANDAVRLGFIGMGGRGNEMLNAFSPLPGVRVAAVCDADRSRAEEAAAKHPGAMTATDMRRVLESDAVDAVVITTCNHWHCLAAIWACRAGKDVYVEKPLGHNIAEQEALVRAAAETGRVVQVGTQQRSDPAHQEARRLLQEERVLGELSHVVAARLGKRDPIGKRARPLTIPSEVDYALWLGPARNEPLYRERLHYDWHWDWNTGSGEFGNWGVHILDDLRSVVFADAAPCPSRVTGAGGRVGWNDAGATPNLHAAHFETDAVPVSVVLSNHEAPRKLSDRIGYEGPDSGYVAVGEGGKLHGQRGEYALFDEDGKLVKRWKGNGGGGHQRNFVQAIRAGDPGMVNSPLPAVHASSAWCHLANMAALQAEEPTTPGDAWAPLGEALNAESAARGGGPLAAGVIELDASAQQVTSQLGDAASNLLSRNEPTDGFDPLVA